MLNDVLIAFSDLRPPILHRCEVLQSSVSSPNTVGIFFFLHIHSFKFQKMEFVVVFVEKSPEVDIRFRSTYIKFGEEKSSSVRKSLT